METTTTIQLLKSTIGNPITRKLIQGFGYCEKCGKHSIEVALELYIGARKHACLRCRIAEQIISNIIKTGGSTFGVDPAVIKQQFQNPYWRKGLANVLTGIATFGVHKPFITGAPFLVVWDITTACNLHCKHCYANAGKTSDAELTTTEAKRAIDALDRASVPIIAFSGGEPLVRKDVFELARYATGKGIFVAMATNGTLITQEKAQEMKQAGIQFAQISLDGATAKTHDAFRGTPGVFERTIQGIKNCVAEGLFVNIATTATKYNYAEIPRIITLCEQLKVNWFMIYNFIPTGRGEFIAQNDLSAFEREMLLKELWRKLQSGSTVNVLSTAPQFARVALEAAQGSTTKVIPTHFANPSLDGQLLNLAEFIGGCGCGRFYCAIRANGNIEPCVFFPLKIGNIKEDNFRELWTTNPILQDLRDKDKLEGNCGQCDYRYYCGGCRARAYGYTGNYLAADPGCIRNAPLPHPTPLYRTVPELLLTRRQRQEEEELLVP
jgi:radical SAM protein with 4Fe4S-binding SPASM domain